MPTSLTPPSPVVSLEPSAHERLRDRLHQGADFLLQILIGHDQRLDRVTRVAAAGRDGLVGCSFELGRILCGVGLWIWLGAVRHLRFRVDLMGTMFSFCSHDVKHPKPPISSALDHRSRVGGLLSEFMAQRRGFFPRGGGKRWNPKRPYHVALE